MPNWVTNKIKAAPHVISAMLNEKGVIDFETIAPFPGEHDWDGIYGDAETAAEAVLGMPTSDHPMLAAMQAGSRKSVDIKKLSDQSFEQFIGMLQNHRKCGHLHSMDFARSVWGTKWNACEPSANPVDGAAQFETAWSCPEGILKHLSKRFPNERIEVTFADEDIGSNCGTFTLLNGEAVEANIAPSWGSMDETAKSHWRKFACEVTGRDAADYED